MKDILEYQKLDFQVLKLEREKNSLKEKDVMNKMISYVKDAQNKSLILENDAKSLLDDYNSLKKQYNELSKKIQNLLRENVQSMQSIEQIDSNLVSANTLSSQLFMVERNINIIITKIRDLLKQFEQAKSSALKARTKHKEAKDNYNNKIAEIEPKIEAIKKQMKELEKGINRELFERYKSVKADGIFPVYVNVRDGGANIFKCGGCGMEIPKGKVDLLKSNGYIVCEQCRRVILNV